MCYFFFCLQPFVLFIELLRDSLANFYFISHFPSYLFVSVSFWFNGTERGKRKGREQKKFLYQKQLAVHICSIRTSINNAKTFCFVCIEPRLLFTAFNLVIYFRIQNSCPNYFQWKINQAFQKYTHSVGSAFWYFFFFLLFVDDVGCTTLLIWLVIWLMICEIDAYSEGKVPIAEMFTLVNGNNDLFALVWKINYDEKCWT